jgi:hypothetical protein
MSGESAYKLAAVDPQRDLALGVFNKDHELRAIGRFYLDEGGKTAEVAFVDHEATRRAGIAGTLLGELAVAAQERGIETFWASVMPDNHAMAGHFLRAGGTSKDPVNAPERHFDIPIAGVLSRYREFQNQKRIVKR